MIMEAVVISIGSGSLLVRDTNTGREVRVILRNSRRFSPGDRVRITYNGVMTQSIPPQITAISIQRLPAPPPQIPREIRVTVIQVRRGSLLVRSADNNHMVVNYPHARHFCAGQRVTVKHDRVIMNNPIEVNATDVLPICR